MELNRTEREEQNTANLFFNNFDEQLRVATNIKLRNNMKKMDAWKRTKHVAYTGFSAYFIVADLLTGIDVTSDTARFHWLTTFFRLTSTGHRPVQAATDAVLVKIYCNIILYLHAIKSRNQYKIS